MTLWLTFVIASSTILIAVLIHTLLTKRYPIRVRIVLLLGYFLLGYWGYKQYIIFEIERPKISKPTPIVDKSLQPRLPLPIEEESKIKEYLNKTSKDQPIIIGVPRQVQIQFTDPSYPSSPHAVFQIVFENKGNQIANNISIEWDIKDMGANARRITPPDEWSRIVGKKPETYTLTPKMGFLQIYGPEIGAYAEKDPPDIEVAITVRYTDNKSGKFTYYCRSRTLQELSSERIYYFDILEVR
ncbi:MAG: hypothetical protein NG712_02615 [Omnitrophica bacterium]|nr:hypothetical protein [Candidatus Omnitrophota bacterium]